MFDPGKSSSSCSLSLSKNKLASKLKFNELTLSLMDKIKPFCQTHGYVLKTASSAVRRLLKIADQRDPTSNDCSRICEQFGVQRSHLEEIFTMYKKLRAEIEIAYQKTKLFESRDENKANTSAVTLSSDSDCSLHSVNNEQDDDNDEDEQSEYEVAQVTGREVDGIRGGYRYHVVWKGYENGGEDWSDSENWVHESDMSCQALIDEFIERERLNKIERKKKLAEQVARLKEKKKLEEKKKWDYFTSESVSESTINDDERNFISGRKRKIGNRKRYIFPEPDSDSDSDTILDVKMMNKKRKEKHVRKRKKLGVDETGEGLVQKQACSLERTINETNDSGIRRHGDSNSEGSQIKHHNEVLPSSTTHETWDNNLYKYLSKGVDGFERGYEVLKVIAVVREPLKNALEGVVLFKLPNGKIFAQIFPLKRVMDNAYKELVQYFKYAKSPENVLIRYLANKAKSSIS